MTRRTKLTFLLVTAIALAAVPAHADYLRATLGQPMFEVSHTVNVRINDGVAMMRIKRQFANPGKIPDEAGIEIDLPTGAVATGLRIRAKDRWYDGELMEREKAAALYQALTGMGSALPKDPALLQWVWADKIYLQVFPVFAGQVSTVEYTLTVPTRYDGGRYWVSYPRTAVNRDERADKGLPLATPVITVIPGWGDALTPIVIDGKRTASDTAVVLTPPEHAAWEDDVGADASASYASSIIEVPASKKTNAMFSSLKVKLGIRHTYKSDLRVQLLSPGGALVTLCDRSGGGDNNLAGVFPVTLPGPMQGSGTWRLVVSDHAGLDNGSIDEWSLVLGDTTMEAEDLPVFIPDAPENANDAGLAPIGVGANPSNAIWTVRYAKVTASKVHAFGRIEIDAAPQLVPLPRKAQLVFAIDSSYSIKSEMIDAHLAIIRTYVAHVPDAEIEIITARRESKRVFGRFVAAKDLPVAIEKARESGAFALGNGSALDKAMKLGANLLAGRKGPRRLILTSDLLLRTRLTDGEAIAVLDPLPRDIVVHMIKPSVDDSSDARVEMIREERTTHAPIATKHHGIFVALGGLPGTPEKVHAGEKQLLPIVLELVRPTRIEKLKIAGFSLESDVLREGDGIRAFSRDTDAAIPTRVTLTGELWSDPIKKIVWAGDAFSRQAAAFIFSEDEYHDLSEAEQLKVAFMGRAVSPVTSYVAYEPGTRPSNIGLEIGAGGSGFGGGAGGLSGGRNIIGKPELHALVDTKPCVAQHKPAAGWSVTLAVETTRDEIVDVEITRGAGPLANCLLETVWDVRLPDAYSLERQNLVVELR